MAWKKMAPIEGGSKGCLNCVALHAALEMSALLAVGFGGVNVTRDGEMIYSENFVQDEDFWTAQNAEDEAKKDPDHDWRIHFFAPLYEALYQRQGAAHWVLVQKGEGFA